MLFNKDYYYKIKTELYKFQEQYNVKILIAALGGSRSIGTDNNFSDLDVYVIYDDSDITLPFKIKFSSKASNIELHIISCGKECILNNLNLYDNHSLTRKYPTYLYRSEDEIAKNHKLTMYDREDYPRTLIFYTLLGNIIWLFDTSLEDLFLCFSKGLRVIDALDFYYTKLIGNYEHFIKDKKQISARKYITVIQEILYCRYLSENKAIAPMHLDDLLEIYMHDFTNEELFIFNMAYSQNKSTKLSKEQNVMDNLDLLKIFTERWLEILKKAFLNFNNAYFKLNNVENFPYEKN